jgi:hypothetical protein
MPDDIKRLAYHIVIVSYGSNYKLRVGGAPSVSIATTYQRISDVWYRQQNSQHFIYIGMSLWRMVGEHVSVDLRQTISSCTFVSSASQKSQDSLAMSNRRVA